MKEILKYLRQTNSYTQEEIARKLEISRQSYIKYENGDIEPGEKIIRKLSIIYGVREDFIRKNKIPQPEASNKTAFNGYKTDENYGNLSAAEPAVPYSASANTLPDGRRIFEGFFDGTVVRILDSLDGLNLKKGQKFKLYIENEEEEMRRREEAFDKLMSFKGTVPKDFDYKEALYEALEEKYGPFN